MGVNAWRGYKSAKTVDGQNAEHEEHPLAQVGNPEDIEKLLKHDWLSASGRLSPLESLTLTILLVQGAVCPAHT
jgi:hypothetical protein